VREFWLKWINLAKQRIKSDLPAPSLSPASTVATPDQPKKKSKRSKKPLAPTTITNTQIKSPELLKVSLERQEPTNTFSYGVVPVLWTLGLILIILLPMMWTLAGRVSVLEQELHSQKEVAVNTHNKILFLRTFIEILSENITGNKGTFKEHVKYWQTRPELFESMVEGWTKQIDVLYNEISSSKKFLEAAKSLENLNFDRDNVQLPMHEAWFGWKSMLLTIILGTIIWLCTMKREFLYSIILGSKP